MRSLSGNQGVTVLVHYLLYIGVLVIASHIIMAGDKTPITIASKGLTKIIVRQIK